MAETIADRMRMVRGTESQDDFSDLLGVSKDTVGKYERNKIKPGAEVLMALRQKRGVDINWLLTGERAQDPAASSLHQLNHDALAGAIAAVEDLLVERNLALAPPKKAKLISLVYNQLTKSDADVQTRRALISDLLDLAS
ncbi:MAG: helix-turn-helix domain-containing protein [Bacteroidota bacterium]